MIQEFVDSFMAAKPELLKKYGASHPEDYKEILTDVVSIISGASKSYAKPDQKRIHEINDGGYAGMLVYVIAAEGYEPYKYWYVTVDYGSCSGCDTLQGIYGYSSKPPTKEQAVEYWNLALHVVQKIKLMDGV